MKKNNSFGLALMTTMVGFSFSACSNNETEEVFAQESEIRLTSAITPSTRVTDQNLQSTQIVEGRQIGVTITDAKSEHKNVSWTANSDGSLSNNGAPLYWGNGNVTIYAYHPYNANWIGTNHTFTVQTDQSTEEGYLNSDLLSAYKDNVAKSEEAVGITFVHCLSKINITITSDDIPDLSGAEIYICGTNINANCNPLSNGFMNVFTTSKSNIQDIKAGVTTEESNTVSAIIIPQLVEYGTNFIRVELNSKNYYYKLPHEQVFNQFEAYSYTLRLKQKQDLLELKTKVHIIADWDEVSNKISDAGENDGLTDIYVPSAGTLSTLIPESERSYISFLKVSGALNEDDTEFIKNSLGLREVDLTDATIIAGAPNVISESMFNDWSSIVNIKLPKNITRIETMAFDNSALQVVKIPSTVQTIAENAFTNCQLKTVYCYASIPPTCTEYAFDPTVEAILYVPNGSAENYKSATEWKKFSQIKEME